MRDLRSEILENKKLAEGIYRMTLETPKSEFTRPGQFAMVEVPDKFLRRPISVSSYDSSRYTLIYKVVGEGTDIMSRMEPGDYVKGITGLGNGYDLDKIPDGAYLIGGGIGIPPMLELAKQLDCEKSVVLGYRDELFLNDEFEAYGKVYLATEDGSAGTKGNVLDAVKACGIEGDILYACGPTPMLRAIKQYAKENGLECYLSLEEKMACGIGACLACVCKSTQVDDHSKVHNKRVCKEGPVFNAEEVEL